MDRNEILVSLAQALIQAQSYSGQEQPAADVLSDFLLQNRFDEIQTDSYGNIIGSIYGGTPGPAVLLDGHIDTVPVADPSAWAHEPFGGQIADGRLYGRGASDMKGAVAAMAVAIAVFAKEHARAFCGSVHIAGVVCEECFEGVAARSVDSIVKPDIVVIGEASEMNLKIGQRGRAEIKIETYGISAHSANPEKGVNAVYNMCNLIPRLRQIQPPVNDRLGKGILELTDICSSPYPGASVLPSLCTATFDRRLLLGETKKSVLQPIVEQIEQMKSVDGSFQARAYFAVGEEECYTGEKISGERFFPGWLASPDEEYIVKIKRRLDEIGLNPKLTEYNFCTNGSHYAGESGIRTIGYGPSRENLAHTVDEYIELADLHQAVKGYIGILEALLLED